MSRPHRLRAVLGRPGSPGRETRRWRSDSGFTLMELVVVVAIAVALAAIALPLFTNQQEKSTETRLSADLSLAAKLVQMGIDDGSVTAATTVIPSDVPNVGAFAASSQMTVKVVEVPGKGIQYCIRAEANDLVRYWESASGRMVDTPTNPEDCPGSPSTP